MEFPRRALFHWYSEEGMDVRGFTENESNMNELRTMMPLSEGKNS